ncbi:PIN domain-like protein, partial [Dendrothele bispora CBS 962.96]
LPVVLLAIFDGPKRPGHKRDKSVRSVPHWMTARTRDFLEAFGHYSITAPGEAEAELSYLNRIGHIDAVLTDDSDVLVFGAQQIIRNPQDKKKPDTVFLYDVAHFSVQNQTPIMADGLLLFAILQGGDYSKGLPHCGKVTSYALTNTSLGSLLRFATEDYCNNVDLQQYLDDEWAPMLTHQLIHDPDSFIGRKCPKAALAIPAHFPNAKTVRQYVQPLTSPGATNLPSLDITNDIDIQRLVYLCDRLFLWGLDAVIVEKFQKSVWPCTCIQKLLK